MRVRRIASVALVLVSTGCTTTPPDHRDELPRGLAVGRYRGPVNLESLEIAGGPEIGARDTLLVLGRLAPGERQRPDRLYLTQSVVPARGGRSVHWVDPSNTMASWKELSDSELWFAVRRAGGVVLVGCDGGESCSNRLGDWLRERGGEVDREYRRDSALLVRLPSDPAVLAELRSHPEVPYVEATMPRQVSGSRMPQRYEYVGVYRPSMSRGSWIEFGPGDVLWLTHRNRTGWPRTARVAIRG